MIENKKLVHWVSQKTNIKIKNVSTALKLFAGGATIPFVARYRKEQTEGLDEVQLADIQNISNRFEEIEKRKITIFKSIAEQGALDEKLKEKIENTFDLTALEDLYLPYKKKKETKADKAKKMGLLPLAKIIMAQQVADLSALCKRYVNLVVKTEEAALEGARDIIAEWMNERKSLRDLLRREIARQGEFHSKLIKGKEKEAEKYKNYFDAKERINRMAAHRFLAMSRGEKEGFLRLKLVVDQKTFVDTISRFFIKGENKETNLQLSLAAADAWKRLLLPAMETEFKAELKTKADETSIAVFAKNLRQLLMESPLGQKRILALDPGFKSGCKLVCLDETGQLLHNETIYPHPPKNERAKAAKKIKNLVSAYKIETIAIGNGTAGRETDDFIKHLSFPEQLYSFVVNEDGASIYSASPIAREEFPNYDVTVRGAVSIGRRLMDPLAELVKIDAKSIGVGQYQHDVNQKLLKAELDRVVESCVNQVGVNLNTASQYLLQYISGLGPKLAATVVEYRNENGAFNSREALKKVKGFGAKSFEQASGFLRIVNGDNPLEASGIHPEQYSFVENLLTAEKIPLNELTKASERLNKIDWNKYLSEDFGQLSLNDIKKELLNFGKDSRSKRKSFEFDPRVKTIADLKIGMVLPALVSNITNFGAFVNMGVKQDGLVHISKLTEGFVSDPSEVVKLGEEVTVKVVEVDLERKRIQLSMININ